MAFQKAVKARAKGRVSLAGPSGSGKTYTALSIATHMGGRIAVLDTEHGSASKYADIFDFDVLEMDAPFHPDKYVKAIQDAAAEGYDVLVIDSLSHAWSGKGGLLEIVDEIGKRMKTSNSFAAWKDATPIQTRMIEAMLSAPLHIIATMRSKQEYVLEQVERNGRTITQPKKVGMAPIQRDGMEYEFDIFAEIDLEHNLVVSKSRCPKLDSAVINKAGKEFAEAFSEWLTGAEPVNVPKVNDPTPTPEAVEYPSFVEYLGREGEYPILHGEYKGKTVKDLPDKELKKGKESEKLKATYPDLHAAISHLCPPF